MIRFRMYFSSGLRGAELTRTIFYNPATFEESHSVRGKTEGANLGSGTFQWTPAVRALALLMVRSKAATFTEENNTFLLRTCSRGAVSALDYAISRGAVWITEMFGVDSRGNSLSRHIFKRSNSERKRPGPLSLALNEKYMSSRAIEIFLDEKLLIAREDLESLFTSISEHHKESIEITHIGLSQHPHIADEAKTGSALSLDKLQAPFVRELRAMLKTTNIFSLRSLRNALQELKDIPELSCILSSLSTSFEDGERKLSRTQRYGQSLSSAEFKALFPEEKPLRFGVTPSQIGTLSLLRYLRDIKKLPIAIDYSYLHTSDLAKGIQAGTNHFPECCVMTTASYAILPRSSRKEFGPLMVMPAATHAIVGSNANEQTTQLSASAEYLFLSDFPTTPGFWFKALQRGGVLNKSQSRFSHAEPNEAFEALESGDRSMRAILWFPYNVIAQNFTGVAPLLQTPAPGSGLSFIQNILFINSSFDTSVGRRILLARLLRDAWLELLGNEHLCDRLIGSQLREQDYGTYLWRYSGLYRLQNPLVSPIQ